MDNRPKAEGLLKEKERLDTLQRNGYVIIQNPEKFCFGMDAVLLSGFAKAECWILGQERELSPS